jgi:hypothetical protein
MRYTFVDVNGNPVGIHDTDDIKTALEKAVNYQCEIIDRECNPRQIVYNVWDGFDKDYTEYKEMEDLRKWFTSFTKNL